MDEKKSIQSISVRRFKNIKETTFDVSEFNVFIGANNSGKSSIAQIIHFGVSLLQSIELLGKWGAKSVKGLSLSPAQLHYSPCENLYALGNGGKLIEKPEKAIEIDYVMNDGEEINLSISKGRNGNIGVSVKNVSSAKSISSLESPFTIYSPGLAGITKHENYISDGVLLRTIARGDANLVFRNILLRLAKPTQSDSWNNFHEDLQKLFPDIRLEVEFREETDEHISVQAVSENGSIPVELAGTGVLQAVQILSYVHYFHPSIVILDEPDSHLHPNNQRLLCKLLQGVAEERCIQIFLTTHSRHVVDALSGQASFFWVRNGSVELMHQDHDIAVLLDIGALDVKEMVTRTSAKAIVLTEDSIKNGLEALLESSGFPMKETLILAYYGCTNPHNLRPLLELIRHSNNYAKIVVHRDRDYFFDYEIEEWQKQIRNMQAEPFITSGVDIESHFLNSSHISKLNNVDLGQIDKMIEEATKNNKEFSIEKIVNGRTDIEKKRGTFSSLNLGKLAVDAPQYFEGNTVRYRYSKNVLKDLRKSFQEKYSKNLKIFHASEHLLLPELNKIASKISVAQKKI